VPFTPATGPRLLASTQEARAKLAHAVVDLARDSGLSSLHVLFPAPGDAQALRACGLLERSGVQFHWRNAGYRDFEDFLGALSHDKRKKIRQERKRVAAEGVTLRRVTGREATPLDWDFFNRCYRKTHREHRSTPYLTREFFAELARRMPDNVLVIAERAAVSSRPLDLFGVAALPRPLLGRDRARSGPALRGVLPGARVLHRAASPSSRRAGRAQARARGFLPGRRAPSAGSPIRPSTARWTSSWRGKASTSAPTWTS
jgi:hypothetical protein